MEKEAIEITHSKGSMVSWGFGKFINEFFKMAFGTYVFYFYEREIGLNSWITMTGFIIYAIWNAFNDPLLGYLTDRPFKFTKKWGRRFPWVLIGGVPWILSYVFVFLPPSVNPDSLQGAFILFLWIVIMTCVFDTFSSLFIVNYYAIFTDKFRGDSERRLASTLGTMVGALGTGLGAIIPSMFVHYGDQNSYIVQATVVTIICLIALALLVPGSREDQERIDRYLEKCEEGMMEKESFLKELMTILKHKNFFHYTVAYTCYMSLVALMIASIPYITEFVLAMEASDTTIIMASMLVGMIVGMPIWGKIAEKTNNDRKTMLISSFCLTIITIPLIFLNNYILILITMFIWGMCQGGYWVMMGPILSQVIDEAIVVTGKRNEGIYNGVQNFISRLALVIQAVSFATLHMLTGFVEGGDLAVQPPAAIIGIQIHFALIPMILMAIATVWFWKFYKLTPDKVQQNSEKIIQMEM